MEAISAQSETTCVATMENHEHRISKSSSEILQSLLSILNKETSEFQKDYNSGAVYRGELYDNKPCGRGLFVWPDGTRYEGDFVNNVRHGTGVQSWPDGGHYEGTFLNDAKHGCGSQLWCNGETYEGNFFKDRCHGQGVYCWPDKGQYNGTFYIDRKEGYGTFTFPDGAKFEGLYKCDERTGPGVMTYPNGCQDVGLWFRERIVKLCFPVENAFTLRNCKDYEDCIDENRKCVPVEGIHSRHDLIGAILGDTPELFDYGSTLSTCELSRELLLDTLPVGCLAADLAAYDEAFFGCFLSAESENEEQHEYSEEQPAENDQVWSEPLNMETDEAASIPRVESSLNRLPSRDITRSAPSLRSAHDDLNENSKVQAQPETCTGYDYTGVVAWNNTPSCMRIQAHILRHQNQQSCVEFDLGAILSGFRGCHGERGPIEVASEQFLMLAANNGLKEIKCLLQNGDVDVNVADVNGHTALIGAVINMHNDVINCLLDNGADVNKLNDDGLSALSICFLFLYPPSSFKSVTDAVESPNETPPPEEKVVKRNVSGKDKKKKKGLNVKVEKSDAIRIKELKKEVEKEVEKAKPQVSDASSMISKNEESARCSPKDRKLGTLCIRRVDKTDPEALLSLNVIPDPVFNEANEMVDINSDQSESGISDFDSHRILLNLPISVPNEQIVKYAEILSGNDMVVDRNRSADILSEGTVRCLAVEKFNRQCLSETMRLLLRRGADPNASFVPMPVLFFAVRSGDAETVRLLLIKGAEAGTQLSPKYGGLSPLHYACLLPGEDGVRIVEYLLNALACPDARAEPDESYLNHYLEEEWSQDEISPKSAQRLGGRTPLHIACSRSDDFKLASKVVRLLMEHRADTNLLCNGHSALSLAITSGNDLAVDELLSFNIHASLRLTHGLGTALCTATLPANESKWKLDDRITLISKLVKAGANMFTPVAVGPKRQIGTVVDYAYYMYSLDKKIASVPYHALAPADRDIYNSRNKLLEHLARLLRKQAVEQETKRFKAEDELGIQKRNPSANFVYTGCGGRLPDAASAAAQRRWISGRQDSIPSEEDIRRPSFHFCYNCGRSIGVRLEPCSRCKAVFYCGKACQNKAWAEFHKDECLRVPGIDKKKTPSATQKDKLHGSRSDLRLPKIGGDSKGKRRKGEGSDDEGSDGEGRDGKRTGRDGDGRDGKRKGRDGEWSDGDGKDGKRRDRDSSKDGKKPGGGAGKDGKRSPRGGTDSDDDDARNRNWHSRSRGASAEDRGRSGKRGKGGLGKSGRPGSGKGSNRQFSGDEGATSAKDKMRGKGKMAAHGELDKHGKKLPLLSSKFAEGTTSAGIGGMASWKYGLPAGSHIGNYSYI